jgi:hypothetical protein
MGALLVENREAIRPAPGKTADSEAAQVIAAAVRERIAAVMAVVQLQIAAVLVVVRLQIAVVVAVVAIESATGKSPTVAAEVPEVAERSEAAEATLHQHDPVALVALPAWEGVPAAVEVPAAVVAGDAGRPECKP